MSERSVTFYRWEDMPKEKLSDVLYRRLITADRVMLAHVYLKKGAIVPRHSHENEQVTCVLSGALKFAFNGQEIVARAGDVVQIPSWLEHEVHVLEDALVIDVFCPLRQDWIDKTDDYFRAQGRGR